MHCHQEWFKLLRRIDAETPRHLDNSLIADNGATHKHAKVPTWLKQHRRFQMQLMPTSASWLNQFERFFSLLIEEQLRRSGSAALRLDRCSHRNPQKSSPQGQALEVGRLLLR